MPRGLSRWRHGSTKLAASCCSVAIWRRCLVKFLHYNLSVIDLPAVAGTTPGEVVHAVRGLRQRDLVIAISFRRGLRQTVEGLRQARANGAYCVGISDTHLSPLARFAHEYFVAPVEGTGVRRVVRGADGAAEHGGGGLR